MHGRPRAADDRRPSGSTAERHLRRIARPTTLPCVLAVVAVTLAAVCPAASASRLRYIATVRAFASDGVRYVAWQAGGSHAPIAVLDTRTGRRRALGSPSGCGLVNDSDGGGREDTAAAGRFLVGCAEGEGLLDVATGAVTMLPNVRRGEISGWTRVGTRYVLGKGAIYDIATGVARRIRHPVDLDARGASMKAYCPAVRRLAYRYQKAGILEDFAATRGLFARASGRRGDAQLDGCHGPAKILRIPRGEREARSFDLRGAVLSWDTGAIAGTYLPKLHRARLYSLRLASGERQSWPLPLTTAGPQGEKDSYGYSTHTANMVFWVAARAYGGPRGGEERQGWGVFAARLTRRRQAAAGTVSAARAKR